MFVAIRNKYLFENNFPWIILICGKGKLKVSILMCVKICFVKHSNLFQGIFLYRILVLPSGKERAFSLCFQYFSLRLRVFLLGLTYQET